MQFLACCEGSAVICHMNSKGGIMHKETVFSQHKKINAAEVTEVTEADIGRLALINPIKFMAIDFVPFTIGKGPILFICVTRLTHISFLFNSH
jgi:hypothetical protein